MWLGTKESFLFYISSSLIYVLITHEVYTLLTCAFLFSINWNYMSFWKRQINKLQLKLVWEIYLNILQKNSWPRIADTKETSIKEGVRMWSGTQQHPSSSTLLWLKELLLWQTNGTGGSVERLSLPIFPVEEETVTMKTSAHQVTNVSKVP